MKDFNKKEIVEMTGLPPRTIQFYTEEGIIIPEIENPGGRGKRRKYSEHNLKQLYILKELIGIGMNLKKIRCFLSNAPEKREIIKAMTNILSSLEES